MAANITATQTSSYTWENSKALNWTHADVRDRSWRNAAVFLHAAALDEQFKVAEATGKTLRAKHSEVVNFADDRPVFFARADFKEAFGVDDVTAKRLSVIREETLFVAEATGKNLHAKRNEVVNVVDDRPVFFAGSELKEAFSVGDVTAKSISAIREEMLFVVDLAANALYRTLNDSFSLKGHYNNTYHLQKLDSLNLTEVREGLRIGQHHHTTVGIVDSAKKGFIRGFAESLRVIESARKGYGLYHDHEIGLTEVREGLNIGQRLNESLKVAEINSNQISRKFGSSFAFKEARFQKDVLKEVQSLLAILDARSIELETWVREFLIVRETPSNKPIKGFSSKFGISSVHGKGYSVNSSEALVVSDAISRTAVFIRAIVEELAILDEVAKNQTVKLAEELKVLDAFLRKADVVLADMVLSALAAGEDVDLDLFESLVTNGAMPGYTNWRDFIPGDYEYTKALFRTIIESKTADRAQIQQLDVAVDVPDLHDRGTVIVTNATAGGVVKFNKDFHIIPDVTLSAKGGLNNPTVPEFLVAPNLNGFTARLRDTITGSYVTGSFTWTAIGY